jgi:hypothetical protein
LTSLSISCTCRCLAHKPKIYNYYYVPNFRTENLS